MALVKQFDDFINEAKKFDKKLWDKSPQLAIRRKFGKDYDKAIDKRVDLMLTATDDPDQAEDWATMDFTQLPDVAIQNVDLDILDEGPDYDEASFQMDKIFGDDQESIEVFQDIEDNGDWKDMVDYIDMYANTDELQRYGIRTTAHVKKWAKKIMKESLNEAKTAKETLRWADDALTKTIQGSKFPKSYVKDYLKSLERMARKSPGLFVKLYGEFTINDYLEDVRYNLANESEEVSEAKVTAKTISKLTDDLAKKTKELKDNFAKLKKAKTIGEKESYYKQAAKLTKEKKAIDAELELAIQNFGHDMELDPNFESVTEAKYNSSNDSDDIFFLWDDIVDDGRKGISHGVETDGGKRYSMFTLGDQKTSTKEEDLTKFEEEVEKLMKKKKWKYEMGDDFLKIYQ